MGLRVAELEALFTADTRDFDTKAKAVAKQTEDLSKKDPKVKVDADNKPALEGLQKVETAAKKLVSQETIAKVDANIAAAEANVKSIKGDLDYLDGLSSTMDVDSDIQAAKSELGTAEALLNDLKGARAVMDVDADTSGAESAMGGLSDIASDAGGKAGDAGGDAFGGKLSGAIGKLGVAGAVLGAVTMLGGAIVQALNDGMQVEVRQDRLQALTGISEEQASFLARQAGEVYAQNYGESIAGNMDIAREALQQGLLDPDATRQDAQKVISSLAGIADVMGEDVQPITRAVTQMMRTGLVSSAEEAFDVIAAGQREGVNSGEDLLDTFIEYGTHFRDLGISAPEALGLLNQGLEGGAFNADKVADALKEMTIRVKEGDTATRESLEYIGLDSNKMQDAIAAGGPAARQALTDILEGLQEIEDPSERAAVAVDIFGTQAEDMAGALNGLDMSTAVSSLNGVEGAAQNMFDTLAENDASSIETAKRNIEVAADGIKGALAAAFSEPLGDAADWVSMNRGPIMEFLMAMANGALTIGEGIVNGFAAGVEGVGSFVGALGDGMEMALNAIAPIYEAFERITPGSQGYTEWKEWSAGAIQGFDDFEQGAKDTADSVRETFLPAIDDARARLNEFGQPIIDEAYLHDATLRLAGAVAEVGVAADGTTLSMAGLDEANIVASASGSILERQIVAAASALEDELVAAEAAGEGQAELTTRYNTTRDALISQATQMGLSQEAASALVDTILTTPATSSTAYSSNSDEQKGKVQALADRIVTLPDGSITVTADTAPATSGLAGWIETNNNKRIAVFIDAKQGTSYSVNGTGVRYNHDGNILIPMAAGGLTPMASQAQMVSPNTWRIVGDRMDVEELYAPLDGSARSWALLLEGFARMPGRPPALMGDGGITPGMNGPMPGHAMQRVTEVIQVMLPDGRVLAETIREYDRSLG